VGKGGPSFHLVHRQRDQDHDRRERHAADDHDASGFGTCDPMPVEIAAGSRPTPPNDAGHHHRPRERCEIASLRSQ